MCDEVYYNNPTDQIGSVGIYWAGITNKDGDTDPQTGGTWHIVYDPESYDKNRFVRDLAESNDDSIIVEELKKDGEVFRNYIKERRPNVKEEHLHGKMFDVKDVEGILVTGQATMQETFNRIIEYPNCDVNDDGYADMLDAVDILKYVIETPVETFDPYLADFDEDEDEGMGMRF